MGYAVDNYQPSVVELARAGNVRAIAHWLNVFLAPHNLRAQVGISQPSDTLQILVEFHPIENLDAKSIEFRKSLVRFVCHHLWRLNSDLIEQVQVSARLIDKSRMLWRQSARVISPARRAKIGEKPTLKVKDSPRSDAHLRVQQEFAVLKERLQLMTRQRVQFRTVRSLLLTGTTAAAFIIGCWLGHSDAPPEQTQASASSSGIKISRPDSVTFSSGSVPVTPMSGNSASSDVTLMFGGDVALTENYASLVKGDHKWAFAAMEEARQADITMVNLDAPFTKSETSSESAPKADPAQVEALKQGGVDIVNLADTQTMAHQASGLEETLNTLKQAGIASVGAGENAKAAQRPKIVDVKGQRIAYLGYSTSDSNLAEEMRAGVNGGQRDRILADIQAIRPQVDWIVMNLHWDNEIAKYPADWQIELAHAMIDHGADLVVGHHANVLQGAEIYKGRPIAYSLGNFIFGDKASSDYDTAVLKVAVKDQQMKVELLPVEVKGLQPRVVHGDRASAILKQVEQVSDGFPKALTSPVVLNARSIESPTVPDTPKSEQPQPDVSHPDATQPDATQKPAPASSEKPIDRSAEPTIEETPESQPANLDLKVPEATESEPDGTASEGTEPPEHSSEPPVDRPPVEPNVTPQVEPNLGPSAEPIAEPSAPPAAESQPFTAPAPSPSAAPDGSQPAPNNSFISSPDSPFGTHHNSGPMVPQQAVPSGTPTEAPAAPVPGSAPEASPDAPSDAAPTSTTVPSTQESTPAADRHGNVHLNEIQVGQVHGEAESDMVTQTVATSSTPSSTPVHSLEPRKRRYA